MSLQIRCLPDKLHELSRKINDWSIRTEIYSIVQKAEGVSKCVTKAFSVTGKDVLQQKTRLLRVYCPSRVDIERLSQTLTLFKSDLQSCTNELITMKTSINNFIGVNRLSIKLKGTEIKEAKIALEGLNKQIKITEEDIRKYEEEAANEERGASDLDSRAHDLRREAENHKEKGWIWGIVSTTVGIVFAPFTLGVSLGAGLISAGVGMAVNFDNANDCERTAARLRVSAEDKREIAKRKRKSKEDYESKRFTKTIELRNCQANIDDLTRTCDGLASLEGLLTQSISAFERAIYVAQDFENGVHRTLLQGDSFQLIKEVFMECPEELHDEAHKEMRKLKMKWIQLEQMFLSNSDHHGIMF